MRMDIFATFTADSPAVRPSSSPMLSQSRPVTHQVSSRTSSTTSTSSGLESTAKKASGPIFSHHSGVSRTPVHTRAQTGSSSDAEQHGAAVPAGAALTVRGRSVLLGRAVEEWRVDGRGHRGATWPGLAGGS